MTASSSDFHWRCSCGDGHFLSVIWSADDERPDGQAEVGGEIRVEGHWPSSWRQRLAQAWRVLRGGCATSGAWVSLDARKAREIAAALTGFADAAGGANAQPEFLSAFTVSRDDGAGSGDASEPVT